MLKLTDRKVPASLEEAYELLQLPGHRALAGGTLSQLKEEPPMAGVELGHLLPEGIQEENGRIRIGAMTSLRALEASRLLAGGSLSVVPAAVRHLQGPALRNLITVGGAVAARFPQSEFLTVLLVLEARVELFRGGSVPLEAYLREPPRDIVCAVTLERGAERAGLCAVRGSFVEQPLLCAAASLREGMWRVAAGARPALAELVLHPADGNTQDIAAACAARFAMDSDWRCSADYRRRICPALIRRAMEEEGSCR